MDSKDLRRISGTDFIKKFCEAHGIPADMAHTITITANFGGYVDIEIHFFGDVRIFEMNELIAAKSDKKEE